MLKKDKFASAFNKKQKTKVVTSALGQHVFLAFDCKVYFFCKKNTYQKIAITSEF